MNYKTNLARSVILTDDGISITAVPNYENKVSNENVIINLEKGIISFKNKFKKGGKNNGTNKS